MKKSIPGFVATALVVMTVGSQAWAFGNIDTTFNNNRDNSQKIGGNSSQNSGNHYLSSSTSLSNRNDNRQWHDSHNDSHNDNSQRTDSHADYSNRSDNRVDNTRNQSHNLGDNSIMINGGYQPRVGHDNASVGSVSGENNYVNNSVSGNFGIGHTTTVTNPAQ